MHGEDNIKIFCRVIFLKTEDCEGEVGVVLYSV
jgi:hypothetical protein